MRINLVAVAALKDEFVYLRRIANGLFIAIVVVLFAFGAAFLAIWKIGWSEQGLKVQRVATGDTSTLQEKAQNSGSVVPQEPVDSRVTFDQESQLLGSSLSHFAPSLALAGRDPPSPSVPRPSRFEAATQGIQENLDCAKFRQQNDRIDIATPAGFTDIHPKNELENKIAIGRAVWKADCKASHDGELVVISTKIDFAFGTFDVQISVRPSSGLTRLYAIRVAQVAPSRPVGAESVAFRTLELRPDGTRRGPPIHAGVSVEAAGLEYTAASAGALVARGIDRNFQESAWLDARFVKGKRNFMITVGLPNLGSL